MIQRALVTKKKGISTLEAKKVLEELGYLIVGPVKAEKEDLALIGRFQEVVADHCNSVLGKTATADLKLNYKTLQKFYQRASLLGIDKVSARKSLEASIDGLCSFGNELGIKWKFMTLALFTSPRGAWLHELIADKFAEKKTQFEEGEEGQEFFGKVYDDNSDECFRLQAEARRQEILNLELGNISNGKKEDC